MIWFTVKIDYKEFRFADSVSAMEFAHQALVNQTEHYTITIELKKETTNASHIDDEI